MEMTQPQFPGRKDSSGWRRELADGEWCCHCPCHYSFKPGDWEKSVALPHNRQISPGQCVFLSNHIFLGLPLVSIDSFCNWDIHPHPHKVCGFRFVCDLDIQIVCQPKVSNSSASRKFLNKTKLLSVDKCSMCVCSFGLCVFIFYWIAQICAGITINQPNGNCSRYL